MTRTVQVNNLRMVSRTPVVSRKAVEANEALAKEVEEVKARQQNVEQEAGTARADSCRGQQAARGQQEVRAIPLILLIHLILARWRSGCSRSRRPRQD